MFSGCLQDFSRMFSVCSDGSCGPGEIWWSFQMKVWTLMIQRNSMIPNYLMIPSYLMISSYSMINWSMDFDNPKVYGDTSITDGLVASLKLPCHWHHMASHKSAVSYFLIILRHLFNWFCLNVTDVQMSLSSWFPPGVLSSPHSAGDVTDITIQVSNR